MIAFTEAWAVFSSKTGCLGCRFSTGGIFQTPFLSGKPKHWRYPRQKKLRVQIRFFDMEATNPSRHPRARFVACRFQLGVERSDREYDRLGNKLTQQEFQAVKRQLFISA